MLNDAVVA